MGICSSQKKKKLVAQYHATPLRLRNVPLPQEDMNVVFQKTIKKEDPPRNYITLPLSLVLYADDLRTVQMEWMLINTRLSKFAKIFYEKLFVKSPESELMFKGSVKRRYFMLKEAMKFITCPMVVPETRDALIAEISKRHKFHDIKPQQLADYFDVICNMPNRCMSSWLRVCNVSAYQLLSHYIPMYYAKKVLAPSARETIKLKVLKD